MSCFRLVLRTFIASLAATAMITAISGCNEAAIGDAPADAASTADARPQADANDACQGAPVQDWYLDSDDDGYGDPDVSVQSCIPVPDHVTNNGDCDDGLVDVNPDGTEICGDDLDNDCVGGDPCSLSMIAHWRFDEGAGTMATDSTGNGHHGTMNNGAGWSGDGLSADFDGDNDYVEVPHSDVFALAEGTITLWFQTRTATTDQGLWSKDSSGFDTGGHLGIYIDYDGNTGSNRLRVRLQSPDSSYYVEYDNIDAGIWYHVAVSSQEMGHIG